MEKETEEQEGEYKGETRREQAKRWKLGESKRQPGSSTALNLFDPVRLARRSSRYIPVAGWAQSEREGQRDSEKERERAAEERSREKLVGNLCRVESRGSTRGN